MTEKVPTQPPAPIQRPDRLPPEVFHFPAEQIRAGYYSDKYFIYARQVLLAEKDRSTVTMQVFQKKHACLCGIDEAIALLKKCLTEGFNASDIEIRALRDGDMISPREPVMQITGPYAAFAHLETLYLGTLARGTSIASNTRRVVEVAWPKAVIFFPARHDHWTVQESDGYAAYVAGAVGVSTDAQASRWGSSGIGTLPHALIAAVGGDTVAAAQAFLRTIPHGVRLIPLVDFENDSVATSLALARALGSQLWGVRLDTSETMVDKSIVPMMGSFKPTGVNAQLVWNVRNALDAEGFKEIKIVVSGGFSADKVREFSEAGVPADAYGVGSSLFVDRYDFTADIVLREGRPVAKAGRSFIQNPRLRVVD